MIFFLQLNDSPIPQATATVASQGIHYTIYLHPRSCQMSNQESSRHKPVHFSSPPTLNTISTSNFQKEYILTNCNLTTLPMRQEKPLYLTSEGFLYVFRTWRLETWNKVDVVFHTLSYVMAISYLLCEILWCLMLNS